MRGLGACVLKIDFMYKLAKKIKVHWCETEEVVTWQRNGAAGIALAAPAANNGQGLTQSSFKRRRITVFRPYKAIMTVQNEDNLTVLWKAVAGSESMKRVLPDLRRLHDRCNRNRGYGPHLHSNSMQCIYVDNCCTVRNLLQSVFSLTCWVKLDPFHWMKRWDVILFKPKNETSGMFRGMMSRALFAVNDAELARARGVVQEKLNRTPTYKEVMIESNAVIPPKDLLLRNVQAVLAHFRSIDALIDTRRTNNPGTVHPKQYLKSSTSPIYVNGKKTSVQNVIDNQLSHIARDCLSDPPGNIVNLFRTNPLSGKTYCARGTPASEADNYWLNMLAGSTIGIHRAERLIATFFEMSNERKRVRRLGEVEHPTFRTEVLAFANSLAAAAGVDFVPFADLAMPTMQPRRFLEEIGFAYNLSHKYDGIRDVTNPADPLNEFRDYAEDDSDNEEEASDNEEENADEDDDVAVVQTGETGEAPVADDVVDDEVEAAGNYDAADAANAATIETAVEQWYPNVIVDVDHQETTTECFRRLAMDRPWVPFHEGTPRTVVDVAEHALFTLWKASYVKKQNGFILFQDAWNKEVGLRHGKHLEGDESVVVIH